MLKQFIVRLRSMLMSKKGQGMVEYGLIIGLVAVLLITALTGMRTQIEGIFGQITTALTGTGTGG